MKVYQVKVYFKESLCPQVLDTFRTRTMADAYIETVKDQWTDPDVIALRVLEYTVK